jgi:hypothetical protein
MFSRLFDWFGLPPPRQDPTRDLGTFDIPENRDILHGRNPVFGWTGDPYTRSGVLPSDTHPDMIEYLWEKCAADLPSKSRWMVAGMAVLVHPDSKIIFASCSGTHSVTFRMPKDLVTKDITWVYSNLELKEDVPRARVAFEFAGSSARSSSPPTTALEPRHSS